MCQQLKLNKKWDLWKQNECLCLHYRSVCLHLGIYCYNLNPLTNQWSILTKNINKLLLNSCWTCFACVKYGPPPKKNSPSFWPNVPLWLWEKFTCMEIDNVYNNACISICTSSIPCRMHTWFNHMCYLIILLPMTTNSKFWQAKESLNTKYGVPMSQTQNICLTLDKSLKHC